MDWTEAIDGYCERLAPGLWAEPVNLVTNAAFVIAGLVMWHRCAGAPTGRLLSAVLVLIGIGSALFHALANAWSSLADVLPILAFIVIYIHVAHRDFVGLRGIAALAASVAAVLALVPLSWLIGRVVPGAGANAAYGAVALLILGYGQVLWAVVPATGRRLVGGALLLMVSIAFRSLDMAVCTNWPVGTHFIWHLFNALMLGWMIEVWRLHRLEAGGAGR